MEMESHAAAPAQPAGAIPLSPDVAPDETWSVEQLLDYGRKALREGEECDMLVVPLARRSIVARFGAGHAYSILRSRLKPLGKWCSFQEEYKLPRTSIWEVVEVYEAATLDGMNEYDLVDRYSNWTGILLAYGLAKPRKNNVGGCVVERLEPPAEDDDTQDEDDDDLDEEDSDDEPESDLDDDTEEDPSDADPPETAEDEPPPVTDDQIGAADAFVSAVGGLAHAVRVLITKGANSGDRQAVKDAVAEAVRTARAILTPSEIAEIVIVGNCKAKGIDLVSV